MKEQSNGNGNLSSLKMKLIFPLRAYECSAKMCDSLFHCDCTEGILADVHSLLLLYIVYTYTVPDAGDYRTISASVSLKRHKRHLIPLSNKSSCAKGLFVLTDNSYILSYHFISYLLKIYKWVTCML